MRDRDVGDHFGRGRAAQAEGTVEMTAAEDKQIVDFFANPFIRFVDLSPGLAAQSRQIQWKFGLQVRDAIHVVSAIAGRADVIETYDPDLRRVDPKQVPGCPEIREPRAKDLPLFRD